MLEQSPRSTEQLMRNTFAHHITDAKRDAGDNIKGGGGGRGGGGACNSVPTVMLGAAAGLYLSAQAKTFRVE